MVKEDRKMIRGWAEHTESLSGRHVVVTGAQGGIGRATAKEFADAGASVIAVDKTLDEANRVASWLARRTPKSVHSPVAMDFANLSSIADGLRQIRAIR